MPKDSEPKGFEGPKDAEPKGFEAPIDVAPYEGVGRATLWGAVAFRLLFESNKQKAQSATKIVSRRTRIFF